MIVKTCITLLTLLTLLVVSYPAYLWITYIDKTVTSGDAFGLNIGSTKAEVYEQLPQVLDGIVAFNDSAFIRIEATSSSSLELATREGHSVMVKPRFHKIGYETFRKKNLWSFYINGIYFNSLKLEFCEEKLCEIRRRRQYFELP